jgi:hypothetical protein
MDHFGSKPRSGNRPLPLSMVLREALSALEDASYQLESLEGFIRDAEDLVERAIALSPDDEDEVADEAD